MSHVASAAGLPLGKRFGLAAVQATARDLLPVVRIRTLHAVLVTLLVVIQYWLQVTPIIGAQPRVLAAVFVGMFVWNVGFWITGFIIIAIVQRRVPPGAARYAILVLTILAWSGFAVMDMPWRPLSSFIVIELGLATPASFTFEALWVYTDYLLVAVWYYESSDRARRCLGATRQAELARRGAEQWLLELRLHSLQARLDPQVLFDTLDRASSLYRSHAATAEALLDALIAYLRRALPQMRQPQPTLGSEVDLAVAYMRILRAPGDEPIEIESHVDPAVAGLRFPPMVVQPLADALVRTASKGTGAARLRIAASRHEDRMRLVISARPVRARPDAARIAEVRHTLEAMFDGVVRMEILGPADGVLSIIVEVGYDEAPRTDR